MYLEYEGRICEDSQKSPKQPAPTELSGRFLGAFPRSRYSSQKDYFRGDTSLSLPQTPTG